MESSENEEQKNNNSKTEPTKNSNKKEETERAARNKNSVRKGIGTLWDNIKGAFRGSAKDIFILKVKLAIYGVIAIMIFFALIVQGDANDTSDSSDSAISNTYSGSTSAGAQMYEETGSTILATEEEVEQMKENLGDEIASSKEGVHESLMTVYSGKGSNTVANRIIHITTNYELGETKELPKVTNSVVHLAGEASPSQSRTLYEHILMSEKYNFNNIIWRSFIKDGSGLKEESVGLKVDTASKLKYPIADSNNLDSASQDLNFFITKVRPYLQSHHIAYDLVVGTVDSKSGSTLNSDFGYEMLTSAYHEIVVDRYKMETLTRTTNYAVYDKTTEVTTITRKCVDYNMTLPDRVITYPLCQDVEETKTIVEKDIREDLVLTSPDKTSYRWNYVVSLAKMFDRAIYNEYEFKPYTRYSKANFNSYINKSGSYENMTVEQFKASEEANSGADEYKHESKDYYKTMDPEPQTFEPNVPDANVKEPFSNFVKVEGTETEQIIYKDEKIILEGKEYTDVYTWSDSLSFSGTTSGVYNVDSVKDVTGNDLSSSDIKYYNDLYIDKEINLVDLMNSDKDIYSNYVATEDMSSSTNNIGIRKDALGISYNVLKRDLKALAENYPISGLMYGSSLGVDGFTLLSGITISTAGGINNAIVTLANEFVGKDLNYMLSIDDTGTFFENEWCAMFVSYCMRKIEKESGTDIPIPSFTGCSTFWRKYNTKPGFFDVKNTTAPKTDSTANLATLEGIQPGDIVLIRYASEREYPRNHTAIVKSVEKDENGIVTKVTTIDGNWNGYDASGNWSCKNSHVTICNHDLSEIASYISVSTVISEAQKGNIW